MARSTNAYGLTNPLQPVFPVPIQSDRDPTTKDRNFEVGSVWINTVDERAYTLVSVRGGGATWALASPGSSDVDTLTGDSGGPISPGGGNITLAGGSNITTSGAGNTITTALNPAISVTTAETTTSLTTPLIIGGSAGNLFVELGDAAGATSLKVTDSTPADVFEVNSDGDITAAGTTHVIGTSNTATSVSLASGTGGNEVNIANAAQTGASTVNILNGNLAADGVVNILSGAPSGGTQTLNLASSTNNTQVNIAGGTGFHSVQIGHVGSGPIAATSAGDISFQSAAVGTSAIEFHATDGNGGISLIAGTNHININGRLNFVSSGNKLLWDNVATTPTAGANAIGSVTLVAGTITVTTDAVTADSLIYIWRQSIGSTGAAALGHLAVGLIVPGTSFVINALEPADATAVQTTDVSVVGWMIVN